MTDLVVDVIDRGGGDARARFGLATAQALACDAGEAAALDTCQRHELYTFTAARVPRADDGERLVGRAAVGHLLRVAAGLESRLVGEEEVLGQVRRALTAATTAGTIGPALQVAFTDAIRAGRRVRRETPLGEARSWPDAVRRCLEQRLGKRERTRVAILGTGALGSGIARALDEAGGCDLTIVGRNPARVDQIARATGAVPRALTEFLAHGGRYDAVITALRTEEPVILRHTTSLVVTPLFVDLGVPPNVDPDVASVLTRVALDGVARSSTPVAGAAEAGAIVDAMVARTYDRLHHAVARREAAAAARRVAWSA
ncbi:MAG: 2-dehydropantoate 2-reductase N-terminal domain-containing protein [Gemmatimonadaceae bacterium]